jgi:hypothetical protein
MAASIRWTLVLLYLALVLPLPLLAPDPLRLPLGVALPLGLALVLAATSEQVEVGEELLQVRYPRWCRWLIRRGWSLPWSQVAALVPVGTSQGGRVYYVRRRDGGPAALLPQRVDRFEEFLAAFTARSGVSTAGITRLTPPWTYQLLALLSGLLLLGEGIGLVLWQPLAG